VLSDAYGKSKRQNTPTGGALTSGFPNVAGEAWRKISGMVDRFDEIVKAMKVLMARANELAAEHAKIVREFQALQQELQALKQDQSAKRKA